jgi:hypothetical protein
LFDEQIRNPRGIVVHPSLRFNCCYTLNYYCLK